MEDLKVKVGEEEKEKEKQSIGSAKSDEAEDEASEDVAALREKQKALMSGRAS